MAIKPNDSDVFLREVDEELRRERMNRFMTRYGWAIIAGIVLFLGAIGGWIWWQNRQQQQAAAEGETLVGALESLEAGNAKAAEPEIMRAASKGIVHKNTASRKVSRLSHRVKSISA